MIRRRQESLNVMEMITAVDASVKSEMVGGSLDLFDEFGGDARQLGVGSLGRGEAKIDRRARIQGEAQRLQSIVRGVGVHRGRIHAIRLPPAEQNQDALIPEGQMGQERGDGPPVGIGAGEVLVGKTAHKKS